MKNKIKIIISCLLIIVMIATCVGCSSTKKDDIVLPEVVNTALLRDPDDFYNDFQNHLITSGMASENYVVSPMALRCAMVAFANGATGDTQKEILLAMGFNNLNEYNAWYKNIMLYETTSSDTTLSDVNIINNLIKTNNKSENFELSNEFVNDVKNKLKIEIKDNSEKTVSLINELVLTETKSQIQNIIPENYNLSNNGIIPVNTIYLKSDWEIPFTYIEDFNGDFTTKSGEKIEKEYMKAVSYYNYYKGDNTELVIIPLKNGFNVAFVVGDASNIYDKIAQAVIQEVRFTVPKSTIETEVPGELFLDYFDKKEMYLSLTKSGDFSSITSDDNFVVQNFIQKIKISINENGIGTPSATLAMSLGETSSQKYADFVINQPYHFFVYNETEEGVYNTLFMGQICK